MAFAVAVLSRRVHRSILCVFFSSRRRHTRYWRDWSSDVCSSDLVTDVGGGPLRAPLAVEPDVAWIGYANQRIREQIEPLLRAALERRGLLRQGGDD